MYSSLKNIQILVSLLKAYNIKHIVISAGTRHTPLVCSVEHDEFFKTYSVVDERSAAFFAIGMIEYLREPVAVCCTSGTAAANYVSAANEAFYQQLPLLLLTADRNHYYLFQQEEQMIPQESLYREVCKKVVTLGHVRDQKDFWYYSRICNEALLELTQGEAGPVHINFIVENDYPIYQGIVKFDQRHLPRIRKIERLCLEDSIEKWAIWARKLNKAKVLIIYGQNRPLHEEEIQIIENFAERYDCVISTDLISNLYCKYSIPTFTLCRALNKLEFKNLCPDIVITMNANSISEIKTKLIPFSDSFEHWHVSMKGQVSDPFKCLPNVIACSPLTFFSKFAELVPDEEKSQHRYFQKWKSEYSRIGMDGSLNEEPIPYSSLYAVQQVLKQIPANSLLHIANSNSIRISNYFTIDPTVVVYDNRGTHGIDGSMSAFIGQAHVSGKLSFLIIGDLSFFYDMNALWNQYIGNNIRILVCNNSGGAIFHNYPNKNNVPTLDEHIAAEHHTSVREWVEARGFEYLKANNKAEIDSLISKLTTVESTKPVLLEVFSEKEMDAQCIRNILRPYMSEDKSIRARISKKAPYKVKKMIKKFVR